MFCCVAFKRSLCCNCAVVVVWRVQLEIGEFSNLIFNYSFNMHVSIVLVVVNVSKYFDVIFNQSINRSEFVWPYTRT